MENLFSGTITVTNFNAVSCDIRTIIVCFKSRSFSLNCIWVYGRAPRGPYVTVCNPKICLKKKKKKKKKKSD